MDQQQALLVGASIGLTIAAPVGPMAVIVMQRTLLRGFPTGMATASGASTVNLLYAMVAICGLDKLASSLQGHRREFAWLLATSLLVLSARMMLRAAKDVARVDRVGSSLARNYFSAIAFNALNPLGFALLLGAISTETGLGSQSPAASWILAAGVFLGSIGWWLLLVATIATFGFRLSSKQIRMLDAGAALFMAGLSVKAFLSAV